MALNRYKAINRINLSGQSGKDFGHRRAFQNLKNRSNSIPRSNFTVPREKKKEDTKTNKSFFIFLKIIALFVLIPVIIFCLSIFQFLYKEVVNSAQVNSILIETMNLEKDKEKAYKKELYIRLLKSGDSLLEEKKYAVAIEEYVKATRIYSFDEIASAKLTSALVQQCLNNNDNCSYAKTHYQFAVKSKFTSFIKLNESDYEVFSEKVGLH